MVRFSSPRSKPKGKGKTNITLSNRVYICIVITGTILATIVSFRTRSNTPTDIVSTTRLPPPYLPSFVKKWNSNNNNNNNDWTVWNHQQVLFASNTNYTCDWRIYSTKTNQTAQICLHPESDIISRSVRATHRWADCDILTKLYQEANYTWHVEIGANIGCCILQMLLTTNAHIIAFEPNPKNLFCLTSTLSKLPESIRQRVTLFPIALGDTLKTTVLNTAIGNYGNGVIENVVKDFEAQQIFSPISIHVEVLDDILAIPTDTQIMMKMDAQGYECYIVNGMTNVLAQTRVMKMEVSSQFLNSFHGCSGSILIGRLRELSFALYELQGNGDQRLIEGQPNPGDHEYVARNTKLETII